MKTLGFALAAMATLVAGPAFAADMAVKAPPPAAALPANDWSGFYLGIAGGGGFGSTTHFNQVFPAGNSGGDSRLEGGLVGGTYGYNWQFGHVLAGFEGDMSWSGIKDTFIAKGGDPGFCPVGLPCYTDLRWLGTDRLRLGYAQDRYMVYATGGVAYGDVNATIVNAAPFGITDETHGRVGYAVGGGIEAMLMGNWSAKLEYLYADFGKRINYNCAPCSPGPALQPEEVYLNSNIVRLGINYRFNGPIAARP